MFDRDPNYIGYYMRYKCVVSYDGSNYSGFQSQHNAHSIQDEIERVISKILNQPTKIVAAGRTDAKVHAYGQVFHFDSDKEISIYKFKYAINGLLPKDIHIEDMEITDQLFHARFCVKAKQYDYLIKMGNYDVFYRNYALYEKHELDIELMKKASLIFIGTHDFTSFNASPLDEYPDQVRCIYDIRFSMENDILRISFIGEGFLRYMVRMLTGCLLEVGKHHMSISDVKKILDAKDKKIFRHNVIGNGLYLMHIDYFKMFYDGNNFIIREYLEKDDISLKDMKIIASRCDNRAVGYIKNDQVYWLIEDQKTIDEYNNAIKNTKF